MQKRELKRAPKTLLVGAILAASAVSFSSFALASTPAQTTTSEQSATTVTSDSDQRSSRKNADRRSKSKRGHHHMAHRMGQAALLIPGYGPVSDEVVTSLSLTTEQTALVDDARTFMKEQRKERRAQYQQKKADSGVLDARSVLDPHAAVKVRQDRMDAMQNTHAEVTQKWLAVWDALDSKQQQTLSEHVNKRAEIRAEKRAERRAKHTERRNQHKADKS